MCSVSEPITLVDRPPEGFRFPSGPDEPGPNYLPAEYRAVDPATRGPTAAVKPRCVFIEVTNHCNLLCETCPRTFTTYETPMTLSWENFLRVVAQFPDMTRAVLHGIGEPLLNRDLPRIIRYLKARGVSVLFNTNATLLSEDWARELITAGLDELRVSIDGASPVTYAQIRGAPLFHKVVKNLKRFCEIQREMGATLPRPSLFMTGMKENIAEVPEVVRLAAWMGVPEVYVQRMVYYVDLKDESSAPGMMTSGHALFDDYDALEARTLAEAEALGRELGVVLKSSGGLTPSKSLEQSQHRDGKPWSACMRPWTTAYVTANGNCLPCCISPFATNDYDSLILGNLFERPFDELWNDVRYQAWREALLSDAPPKPCAGCGVHWSL